MQTSMSNAPAVAAAGRVASTSPIRDVLSRLASTRQLVDFLFTGSNSEVYNIVVNGVTFTFSQPSMSGTAALDVLAMKALFDAVAAPVVKATVGSTSAHLLLEGISYETDVVITYSSTTGSGTLAATTLVTFGQTMNFGLFVCADERTDTLDASCRYPRASADVTTGVGIGVVIEDITAETPRGATAGGFESNRMVPVLRRGVIYVVVEEAVNAGDAAYVRYAAGAGGSILGSFRKSADTSTAAALPGATFRSTQATAGGLAIVELSP